MHNLHLVVCYASSGEDACNTVEDFIMDFGDENNWRTMCGAVSQDNEVYLTDDGRFPPDDSDNTIEKINAKVKGWVESEPWTKYSFDKLMRGEEMNSQDWWGVKEYAKDMVEKVRVDGSEIDVLNDFGYNDYNYDEIGITQTGFDAFEDENEEQKKWVVFVDMHS